MEKLMSIIERFKTMFTKDELEKIQNIPTEMKIIPKQMSNDDEELTEEQYREELFDQYAREYHSMSPEEQQQYLYSVDRYHLMQ